MLIRERLIRLLGGVPAEPKNVIEFLIAPDDIGVIPEPRPAFKHVPQWFKDTKISLDVSDQFGGRSKTAKQCMPLLDGMSAGYVMPLFGDVNVRTNADNTIFEVGNNPYGTVIEFHSSEQFGHLTKGPAVKFINRIIVKTAPGWSTLFLPLLNSQEARFTCMSALVDTDTYVKEVNFPAIWHAANHDAVLTAGTPLVVAIPVHRASLAREALIREISQQEIDNRSLIERCQRVRGSVYAKDLRCPR